VIQAERKKRHAVAGSKFEGELYHPDFEAKLEQNQKLLESFPQPDFGAMHRAKQNADPSGIGVLTCSGGQSRNRTTDTRIFNPDANTCASVTYRADVLQTTK
jgi:hypothetical protein